MAITCPNCGVELRLGRKQSYTRSQHAAYMREWRKKNRARPVSPEQKKRENARAYANNYKKRGHLKERPCEVCGSTPTEMHHHDYSKPLEVTWLCRPCHRQVHFPKSPVRTGIASPRQP